MSREIEREANYFAACLLIPKKQIVEDLKKGFDMTDDKAMKKLCAKYGVSSATMILRLSTLKIKL